MYKQLDSKKIGQAIAKLRTHRDIKAVEIARYLKISEQAYTKYERGETPATITFLNNVAQFFDVNPIHFLQNGPENVVENIHNSTVALNNNVIHTIDKDLIESIKNQLLEKDKQLSQHLQIIQNLSGK